MGQEASNKQFSSLCSCFFFVFFCERANKLAAKLDCKIVLNFCVFKYARAVKQKVWNEAENRDRDWGETLKIRSYRKWKPMDPEKIFIMTSANARTTVELSLFAHAPTKNWTAGFAATFIHPNHHHIQVPLSGLKVVHVLILDLFILKCSIYFANSFKHYSPRAFLVVAFCLFDITQ